MLREVARRLGAGRFVYRTWHAPRGIIQRLCKQGAFNLALARRGRAAMEKAAVELSPLPQAMESAPEIFYLTGRRFVYQTLFCAVSLGRQAEQAFRFVIINDGTLTGGNVALLRRILPGVRIVGNCEVEETLDACLPAGRYPELRRRRLIYPHLRKLTDVHAFGDGWKLVLDSDMLFFGKPDFLLDWLRAPDRPSHMLDVGDAYGYSIALLQELAGSELPVRLNVGICGLKSDAIDWEKLEYWCGELVAREGTHYLMEQAMVALLTAGKPRAVAPEKLYIVCPSRFEAEHPTAILHHYTAESKAWYFRFAWRQIAAAFGQGSDSSPPTAGVQTLN